VRVVAGVGAAVAVEVEPGEDTGVGRRDEGVRVVDRPGAVLAALEVVVAEQVDGLRCVVELVDQQHVRPVALDDLGDLAGLRVVRRRQVGDELARGVPVERGVERREPDGVAAVGLGGRHGEQSGGECQHG
jgi:hypothetical protein